VDPPSGIRLTALKPLPWRHVDEKESPMIVIKTTLGDITLDLDADNAPETVKNFYSYVEEGFYDGTIFHRVIDGFMIQGGGFTGDMTKKSTNAPIKNEAQNGLKNDRGTIAMARTSNPDSATAQFFINLADNEGLNHPNPDGHGYAVFGKVVEGLAVVNQIKKVTTGMKGPHRDVPIEPIAILSITKSES
jgi:peptidyl-prolyl cis-trans isomerase A (cyclophilin A)